MAVPINAAHIDFQMVNSLMAIYVYRIQQSIVLEKEEAFVYKIHRDYNIMTQTEIGDTEAGSAASATALPAPLVDICKALADNPKIIFKSQQIDDPELNQTEKQQIAQDAYRKSLGHFLIRFGNYMDEQQLSEIQELKGECKEDICLLLEDFKRKLHTRNVCVKNRRYNAMQQLLQKGEYFSEHEMMQRAPELYQELVGQYLTEAEKKARDSYDVRNTSFSGILMHTLEQKQRDELLQQVEHSSETVLQQARTTTTAVDCEVPVVCRKQWGGFDDDEPVACSTSRNTDAPKAASPSMGRITTPEYYNPGERELLRNEFMGLMKERFLSGKDSDFDYAAVDDNAQLDDLQQIERDEEDAYFECSDDDDDDDEHDVAAQRAEEDAEDELDIYMRHLNKHPSLQQH